MAKFYIVQKSNWQGDNWRPVAGAFSSKAQANAKKASFEEHPHRTLGGIDIKAEKHAKVVSRTWLARNGYPTTAEGEGRLSQDICLAQEDR